MLDTTAAFHKHSARLTMLSYRLLLVTIASVLLANIVFIDTNSFFIDELYSVIASSESSVPRMLNIWLFPDVHPPLYQFLLMGWINLFGSDETAVRSLSILYYSLSVIAVYFLARKLLGGRMAAFVALITSLAPMALFFAHETRSYAQMFFLSTSGFYLWARGRSDISGKLGLYWCFPILVLLSATHLFGIIFSAAILIFEFVDRLRRRQFGLVLAVAVTGLACLASVAPNILLGGVLDKSGGQFWIGSGFTHNLKQLYSIFPLSIQPFKASPIELALWSALILVAALCSVHGFYKHRAAVSGLFRTEEKTLLGLALWAAGFTVAVSLIVSLGTPIITRNNLLVVLPALCLIVALIASAFARGLSLRMAIPLLVAIVAAEGISAWTWLAERRLPREDIRGAAEYIADHCNEHTRIGSIISDKRTETNDMIRDKFIHNYYISRITASMGKSCREVEIIPVEYFWQEVQNIDYVQIVHLRKVLMDSLAEKLAQRSYDIVSFPTSGDYPTLVISPDRQAGETSQ